MHAALGANVFGVDSAIRSLTALHAVTSHLREHRVMILCQCASTRGTLSTAQWPAISWQTVHEFTGRNARCVSSECCVCHSLNALRMQMSMSHHTKRIQPLRLFLPGK